jgi:hypothetical protein
MLLLLLDRVIEEGGGEWLNTGRRNPIHVLVARKNIAGMHIFFNHVKANLLAHV